MRFIPVFIAALAAAAAIDGKPRGLEPADYYKERVVTETAVSPDGSLVAFTVLSIVEDKNKRNRQIWMQQVENAAPVGEPFPFTLATEDSSSPVWSPDGAALAFQSKRGDKESSTWFIRVTAPGGEAYQMDGVDGAPVWSPDGRWIAYTKRPKDDAAEKKGDENAKATESKEREGWIAPDAITNTLNQKRFDGRVVTQMNYKEDGKFTFLPHSSVEKKSQVYIVPAAGGEAVKLTDLPFDAGSIVWTQDSSSILFTGDPLEDDEYNEDLTTQIYAIDRTGGEPRPLTQNPGSERAPALSPDGRWIAYLYTAERGAPTDLMVAEIAYDGCIIGEPSNLTASWDLIPGAPAWTSAGDALRFSAGIGGNTHVFEVDRAGGPIRQVTQGDRDLSAVSTSKDGSVVAFGVSDPLMPRELAIAAGDGSNETRATRLNDEWLAKIALQPPERLTWRVADGTEIEGWLVKPVGFESGKSYPMVLKIHGGPHAAYGNTWFHTFHVLSGAGMFVLYVNPRGSSGYGHDFMYATRGRWGELDSEDFLKGVDAALAKYPEIDPRRLGVSGGSYGGFMTNWLTATTDRFAAAVTSRSIANWESWYGASDAQQLTEFEFDGKPWEDRETYRRLSPLSYVEKVTAPTLIIHSEQDFRTPIADGEQWYMALKKRGVPVEMVRYPRSSHGLSRTGEPWLLVDRLERIRSWFVHWLMNAP